MNKTKDVLDFIATNVRKYRKHKNLTLDDLAERSNVHKNYLSRLENGDANITINKLVDICSALDIHITDVIPYKYPVPEFASSDVNLKFAYEAITKLTSLYKRNPYYVIDYLDAITDLEESKLRMGQEILTLLTKLNERDLLLIIHLMREMNNVGDEESNETA
jgi:transcriptional regulator with XRE-family HTH domain